MSLPDPIDEARVPVFGTWRSIYAWVIATAVLWIVLSAAFSAWPY